MQSPEKTNRRKQKDPRHISEFRRGTAYQSTEVETDGMDTGDGYALPACLPDGGAHPPTGRGDTAPSSGGNIFNGLAVETDFGGSSTPPHTTQAFAAACSPGIVANPAGYVPTTAGHLFGHSLAAQPLSDDTVRINTQGYTGFGGKTHQIFTKTARMKTRGMHIFVIFLKLGDLQFNVLQDIDRFT